MARRSAISMLLAGLICAGCAARTLQLPTDPGTPLPDAAIVHAQLSRDCSSVKTLTAELALSGQVRGQGLRGRMLAGFARPDSMRLEGVAPFGAPAFILASRGPSATLLLPRDNSVLRNARAEEILGALIGVSLTPDDLLAILTGCVEPAPSVEGGTLHANGWASLKLRGGATIYMTRQGNAWQVRAAVRSPWQIEYAAWAGTFPQTVRLRSDAGNAVDITAGISQLETNAPIPAEAFSIDVPATADPLTLEELRDAGPLRGAS